MTADSGCDLDEIRERLTNERDDLTPLELAEYLSHDHASIRESAVLFVGDVAADDADAAARLIEPVVTLLNDPEHRVRAQAPVALVNLGKSNPGAVQSTLPGLVSLLDDDSGHVRTNAVYALSEMGRQHPDELADAIEGRIPELLDQIEGSVRRTQKQIVEIVLVYATRTNCNGLLEHIDAVATLLSETQGSESSQSGPGPRTGRQQRELTRRAQAEEAALATEIREGAALILLEIADAYPDAVEPYLPTIRSALDDENPAVRQHVIDIFGAVCREPSADLAEHVSKLISVLLNEETGPVVQAKAASAIGEAIETDPTVVETVLPEAAAIRDLLTATDDRLRAAGAGVLSYLAEVDPATAEPATEDLFALLNSDDPLVRGNAVSVLGFIESEDVQIRLAKVRDDDPDEDVRLLAAEILESEFGDRRSAT